MFFKLQPLIYSLVFLLSLEAVLLREDWLELAAFFLILFSVLIVWPLTRKPRFVAMLLFLSLGSLSLLFLVDNHWEKQIFIVVSAVVYYLAVLGGYRLRYYPCDQTALGMVNLATIATVFYWFSSSLGWFLNFQIEPWIMVSFSFVSVFFLTLPSLCTCAIDRKEREKRMQENNFQNSSGDCCFFQIKMLTIIFLNSVLALGIAQVVWGIVFLPFNYLTLGACALIIFYIFWDATRTYLQGFFSCKRVVLNGMIGLVLISGILLTARWELVV